MYQLGKRTQNHRRLRRNVKAGVMLLMLGILSSGLYQLMHLQTKPTSDIQNAKAQVTSSKSDTAMIHIDKPLVSFDLPSGWKPYTVTTSLTPPAFSYRSGGEQVQLISMYIDDIPAGLAVNRVVVVSVQGDRLIHGGISDNCTSFTNPTDTEKNTGKATGKWQGTSFLCDVGNYERNVVGITSTDGINEVTQTGPTAKTHRVFITYTDNSINPDYGTFYGILESFKMK